MRHDIKLPVLLIQNIMRLIRTFIKIKLNIELVIDKNDDVEQALTVITQGIMDW